MKRFSQGCAMMVLAALTVAASGAGATELKGSMSNGLQAVGTERDFEILTRAGAGKSEYFCAAGEFARTRLGASNNDRLVVMSVRGNSRYRGNRLAVSFGVNAPEPPKKDLFRVGGPRVGQSASVGHANALCSVEGGSAAIFD